MKLLLIFIHLLRFFILLSFCHMIKFFFFHHFIEKMTLNLDRLLSVFSLVTCLLVHIRFHFPLIENRFTTVQLLLLSLNNGEEMSLRQNERQAFN